MKYPAGSPQLKNAVEEICPNFAKQKTEEWLKLAAITICINYARLLRLWRDNRGKTSPQEERLIDEKLLEVRLLREIERNLQIQKYQHAIISGEIDELKKMRTFTPSSFGQFFGRHTA